MQFNSNSDFPASHLHSSQWPQLARPPVQFEAADFTSCACITTRVLIQCDDILSNQGLDFGDAHHVVVDGMSFMVKTAKGVLVRTVASNVMQEGEGSAWSDSSSDGCSQDMEVEDKNANIPSQPVKHGLSADPKTHNTSSPQIVERAYWVRRTLRAAIYGQVRYGIVLHRLIPPIQVILPTSPEWVSIDWYETNESVAIKELGWDHIRAHRNRLAEDPIKEVAAMQYLSKWLSREQQHQNTLQLMQLMDAAAGGNLDMNAHFPVINSSPPLFNPPIRVDDGMGGVYNTEIGNDNQWKGRQQMPLPQAAAVQNNISFHQNPPHTLLESHIMMPIDLFSDDRNLYSIMPYCTGGELFDVLEKKSRFTEVESRYWMRQLLAGLSCLKKAGVTHRDLSLENLLVQEGNVLVIDLGMCLRVPFIGHQSSQRCLIQPQGACGKWHYMSPEVCKNKLPFDGPAVDLWAAGVILFLMLTGFPPWEQPDMADERFKYMSNGYLVHMLTEWQVGLSADAMDLLQRMFWLDPTDRLSLEQVCAHPWMTVELK